MQNNSSHNEPKDLHENSDYPVHTPNKGTVEPTKHCCGGIKNWLKKIFG